MPFDRLISAVDRWAGHTGRDDVFAQIGTTKMKPVHIRWTPFLEPNAFTMAVRDADAIVAHAGMGSILTALAASKPIIVVPRRGDLRETRNDHQIATAKKLGSREGIHVAMDEAELSGILDSIDTLAAGVQLTPVAPKPLISAIQTFINQGAKL